MVWVCGMLWCAKIDYCTCTCQIHDLKPVGFPIPVTIPTQLCDTVQYGCLLSNLYYQIYTIYSALWASMKCRSWLCDVVQYGYQLSVPGWSKCRLPNSIKYGTYLHMTSIGL